MNWLYKAKKFTDDMIPDKAIGFVYEMEAIIDGKSVRYIGKKNFYSSNDILKAAHKAGILIKRYIVKICYSKTELTYYETKYQFNKEVLEKEEYLNGNILGKFYKFKSK